MKLAAVILAGGEGSRIGGGKLLRLLGGRTLLARAVERAQSWGTVVIAVRDAAQAADAGLPLILDDPDIAGPLAGLAAGLRFARDASCEALLALPADMPFLPDDLPRRLSAAIGDKQVALAASGENLHPVCGLWRVQAIEALPAYIATGRRSLKGLAEAVGFVAVEWPDDPFFNINLPEDLAEAERRLKA